MLPWFLFHDCEPNLCLDKNRIRYASYAAKTISGSEWLQMQVRQNGCTTALFVWMSRLVAVTFPLTRPSPTKGEREPKNNLFMQMQTAVSTVRSAPVSTRKGAFIHKPLLVKTSPRITGRLMPSSPAYHKPLCAIDAGYLLSGNE